MYYMYRVHIHNVDLPSSWVSTLRLPVSWPLNPQVSPVADTWACEPTRPTAPLQLLVQTQQILPLTGLRHAVHPAAGPGSSLPCCLLHRDTHVHRRVSRLTPRPRGLSSSWPGPPGTSSTDSSGCLIFEDTHVPGSQGTSPICWLVQLDICCQSHVDMGAHTPVVGSADALPL